jgi:Protein of unknown function (DUF2970)
LTMSPKPDDRPIPKKASLLQTIRIVVSMLFMVGRNRDYGPNAPTIDPLRLALVALIGAALLIAGLILLATTIAR